MISLCVLQVATLQRNISDHSIRVSDRSTRVVDYPIRVAQSYHTSIVHYKHK